MSIRKVFFVFLFVKVTSGRLKGIVLSVIMLRFQDSLKLSFSSTFASLYLYYGHLSSISSAASVSFWCITFATPSRLFIHSVGASCSHAAVMCWIVSGSFIIIIIIIFFLLLVLLFFCSAAWVRP
jgi:hypothetical protein